MKTYSINRTTFNGGIIVPAKKNKKNMYLYNQVLDIVKKNQVSAIFSNRGIDFSSASNSIISELSKLGIVFVKK